MINIEKGGLHSGFHSDVSVAESCPRVLSISGGLKINVIPDKAETKVQGLTEKDVMNVVSALPDMHGIGVSCETKGDIVTIRVTGATGLCFSQCRHTGHSPVPHPCGCFVSQAQ